MWQGCYSLEDRYGRVVEILDLPDHVVPLNAIAIGHPAEEKEPGDRYDAARVHHDRW